MFSKRQPVSLKNILFSLLKESKVGKIETKEEKKDSEAKEIKERETRDSKNLSMSMDNITIEERQLLGRYGVWLLVGRCTSDENTTEEVLGRLLAMIFHWFHMTAYSFNGNEINDEVVGVLIKHFKQFKEFLGQEESTLEKLKCDIVCNWLRDISRSYYKLFISCLLPHPPEYARVGGHW